MYEYVCILFNIFSPAAEVEYIYNNNTNVYIFPIDDIYLIESILQLHWF